MRIPDFHLAEPRLLVASLMLSAACAGANAAPADATAVASTTKQNCVSGDGKLVFVQGHHSKLSRWCIDSSVWSQHAADFKKFYPYGNDVVTNLETLFAFTPDGLPFTFEATVPTGGAHTGSDFGFGDTVTGDAFWNDYSYRNASGQVVDVPGFWGYLLSLHEAINDWTGAVTSNWPTDWWADHRSPFPNSMDYHVMQVIGQSEGNATVLAAADAQHRRFGIAGQPEYDSEVAMFDSFYDRFGGFAPYVNMFKLIQVDQMDWSRVAPNPSPVLSEYVIAYLQLGLRTKTDLTQSDFVAAGVGTKDTSIQPYQVSAKDVKSIADAHCSIAGAHTDPNVAQGTIDTALNNLRGGKFAQAFVSSRSCKLTPQSSAPAECSCDGGTLKWVAPWTAAQ
jgi:hypothetical protein